ncbi:Retrovirus-related Pol polyprotein from transposon 297 family [Gossypium australe]|uniref:Retrovirus-related Pol polyprotein from transposon 297 family n=1 Tax=Gossypium australe TaxID=47621 RepID=A0A5B6W5Q2_9ROSI|nr:Retrovirus-related Pol polyprotein from transposon 297 family [Gossypium australe]
MGQSLVAASRPSADKGKGILGGPPSGKSLILPPMQDSLTWDTYARGLRERFGSATFLNPMTELVSLKQTGTADAYHNHFLESVEQEPEATTLILSLHALQRSQGHNTIRIVANMGQVWVIRDSNSPFASLIVMVKLLSKSVLAFFDGILIYSNSWSNHLVHLKDVLQLLRDNKLFDKKSKCTFGTHQIEYLGHVISSGLVTMDTSKVDGVLCWPTPKTVRELRGFLGLSGYYRQFIRHYVILARPLTDLLKKDILWNWIEAANSAFNMLKQAIYQALVLSLLYFKEEFCIDIDTCGQEVGAMLLKKGCMSRNGSYCNTLVAYPGAHTIRHNFLGIVYWKGLSRDVKLWTRECPTCQKCKVDLSASPRLLQPLPIPIRAWESIIMDFVEGLPNSMGKNVIMVVVERSTSYMECSNP